MEGKK